MNTEPTEQRTRENDWTWLSILYFVWGTATCIAALYAGYVFINMLADGKVTIPVLVQQGFWGALIIVLNGIGFYVQTHQLKNRSDANNRKTQDTVVHEMNGKLHAKIKDAVADALAEQGKNG
jgi:hypothetical protein